MKSFRRNKATLAAGKHAANQPGAAQEGADNIPVEDTLLQGKQLMKPENQAQLYETELSEEFTRILNANNPQAPQNIARFSHKERVFKVNATVEHYVSHFELDGTMQFKAEDNLDGLFRTTREDGEGTGQNDEVDQQQRSNDSETGETSIMAALVSAQTGTASADNGKKKDQFHYNERAAQTLNSIHREHGTNTDPPPYKTFSENVNQWSIYDAYIEDAQMKEKNKEKAKITSSKNHKEDDRILVQTEAHNDEAYHKSTEVKRGLVILERMANQNTYDEISQDFKYWEDMSDKISGKKDGSLLPLWKFNYERKKMKQITAICWNTANPDLFAIAYGSYDFSKQGPGIVACFSLKNPSYPEYLFTAPSGVLSIDFNRQHQSMIVAGLYDGNVVVYDLQKKESKPAFMSTTKTGKHRDSVWQVCWQKDDLDENMTFTSISSDGSVKQWSLVKHELLCTDLIVHPDELKKEDPERDELSIDLQGASCIDFHKAFDQYFVIGTERGSLVKCSKEYNARSLLTYLGHDLAVYAVKFNPFNSQMFLSASADWTVKLWDYEKEEPVLSFDLGSPVGDVAWAPYSSTVFGAVTVDGRAVIFDLSVNKYRPVCEQQIVKKTKLTHLAFNPTQSLLLIGDDHGCVISLKLSPNLINIVSEETEQAAKLTEALSIGIIEVF